MTMNKLRYLVVENAPDVCEGIIRRMNPFDNWETLGYCTGVKEAMEKIQDTKPHLLFLDWGLNGGSAFELLQQIQNTHGYNPYIIFNTGFQKDNPEIPQEIINNYKVDKYLVKPIWENLRNNLPAYLTEAAYKAVSNEEKPKITWLEDEKGVKVAVSLEKIICICQHPAMPRSRIFYFTDKGQEIIAPLQWQKCYDLLDSGNIDYFITKTRSHLVVREYIEKFEKPFVRLKNFPAKIEVVKENLKPFETWLTRE
jgi:two-component system, LytTR family, response regulator